MSIHTLWSTKNPDQTNFLNNATFLVVQDSSIGVPHLLTHWVGDVLISELWLTMWLISFWLSSSTLELTTANIIAFLLQPMVWKPVRVIFNVERMQQNIATTFRNLQMMNHVNLEDIQPLQLLCFVRSNIYLFFSKVIIF